MDDQDIISRINELAAEEQRLEEAHVGEGLSEDEQRQLQSMQATLDQLWDVLRQRRAKRKVGANPNDARTRSVDTVEGYLQ
ncbi:MAG TPA: DUF2630 family protein [Acidimicrobiales bacterium]|nr:DUF2630 family protein [Acidimicrobiales bacterium]